MENQLLDQLEKASGEQVISNIERIIASYRSEWDIITELVQNAVDALVDQFGNEELYKGSIFLEIDSTQRSIKIIDNGNGINETDLSSILVNGRSLKRVQNSGKFGFMGYGLTFVAFQSEYINITSIQNGRKCSKTYRDLYKYVYCDGTVNPSDEELNDMLPFITEESNGTIVTVKFPENFPIDKIENNLSQAFLYAKNPSLVEYLLRTRTAIGLLDSLFDPTIKNFHFKLLLDGANVDVNPSFLRTREIVRRVTHTEDQMYEIDTDFKNLVDAIERVNMPEAQRKAALKCSLLDQVIHNVSIGSNNSLKARLYIAATSKSNLNSYEEIIGINDERYGSISVDNGMWLAINGLPTGVCIDQYDSASFLPFSGVIDILDDSIKNEPDAGRKGITPYRVNQIKEAVKETIKQHKFLKYKQYVVGTDTRIGDPLYKPKEELSKIFREKSLHIDIPLMHKYYPPLEEQEVISLFTDLIASGYIKGYYEKVLSGYQVYDGLYEYRISKEEATLFNENNRLGVRSSVFDYYDDKIINEETLIEFKRFQKALYEDIGKLKKDINHISLLVCWDVNYDERDDLLDTHGDQLKIVDRQSNIYYGATHELVSTMRLKPLPIIELKTVINTLFDKQF